MPITVDVVMDCAVISVPLHTLYIVENFIWKNKRKWKCKVNVYHRQSSNFNLKINNICGEIVYFQNGFMAKQSPLAMNTVRFILFSNFSQQTYTTKKNKQTAQSYWINHFVEYVIWSFFLFIFLILGKTILRVCTFSLSPSFLFILSPFILSLY